MKNYTILSLLLIASGLMHGMETSISSKPKAPTLLQTFEKTRLFDKFNAALLSQSFNVPGKKNFELRPDEVTLTDGLYTTIVKEETLKNSRLFTDYLEDCPINQKKRILRIPTTGISLLAHALTIPDFRKETKIGNLFDYAHLCHYFEIGNADSNLKQIYDHMAYLMKRPQSIRSTSYVQKIKAIAQKYQKTVINCALAERILPNILSSELVEELKNKPLTIPAKLIYNLNNTDGKYPCVYGTMTPGLILSSDSEKLFTTCVSESAPYGGEAYKIIALDLKSKSISTSPHIPISEKLLGSTQNLQRVITYNNLCGLSRPKAYSIETLQENTDGCEFFDQTTNRIKRGYGFHEGKTKFIFSKKNNMLLQLNKSKKPYGKEYSIIKWSKQENSPLEADYIDLKFAHCDKTLQPEEKRRLLGHKIAYVTPDGSKILKKTDDSYPKWFTGNYNVYDTATGKYICNLTGAFSMAFSTNDFVICNNYIYGESNIKSPKTKIKSLKSGETLAILEDADFVGKFVIRSDNKTIYGIKKPNSTDDPPYHDKVVAWEFQEAMLERMKTETTFFEKALNIAHQEALEKEGFKPDAPISRAASTGLD